jgi:hypothetical protein
MRSYRKRLGKTSSSSPKCHAEAFPIKPSDDPGVGDGKRYGVERELKNTSRNH